MARGIHKLKPLMLTRASKPGRYADGGGLYLTVSDTGSRAWVFMWVRNGKRRELGLGALIDVPVAAARQKAGKLRAVLADGGDPKAERDRQRAAVAPSVTFKEVAEEYVASHRTGWSAKHIGQWQGSLSAYVYPVIGSLPATAIDVAGVLAVLKPLWSTKPETASRIRGRIEAVLDYATAHNLRTGDNPARWRGHLKHLLPARSKLARVIHYAAMPYNDVPAFMETLAQQSGIDARALRFTVLTACRTGEVLGAKWPEIDLGNAVWTIPAERTKARRGHVVPLSAAALELLRHLPRVTGNNHVFPGARPNKPLSEKALLRAMQRTGVAGYAVVHGMRSSFRDYAAERTNVPREIAEEALSHITGSDVELSYRRTTFLEKRRELMEAWARFCTEPAPASNVVRLAG